MLQHFFLQARQCPPQQPLSAEAIWVTTRRTLVRGRFFFVLIEKCGSIVHRNTTSHSLILDRQVLIRSSEQSVRQQSDSNLETNIISLRFQPCNSPALVHVMAERGFVDTTLSTTPSCASPSSSMESTSSTRRNKHFQDCNTAGLAPMYGLAIALKQCLVDSYGTSFTLPIHARDPLLFSNKHAMLRALPLFILTRLAVQLPIPPFHSRPEITTVGVVKSFPSSFIYRF